MHWQLEGSSEDGFWIVSTSSLARVSPTYVLREDAEALLSRFVHALRRMGG